MEIRDRFSAARSPPGHRATGSKLEGIPMDGELSEVNLDHFAVPSLLKTFGNPNRQQCPSQIVRQDLVFSVLFSSPSPSISQGIKSEELDNIRTLFNQGPKYCLHSTPLSSSDKIHPVSINRVDLIGFPKSNLSLPRPSDVFVRRYDPGKDIGYFVFVDYMLLGFILVPKFVKFIQVLYMYIFIYICIYLQGAKFSPSLCLLPTPKTCLALTFIKSGE